ncbi:MAG: TonB-dependent receptor [Porticoccaceae bacterium]|nr:TonB-dependent receptor [Porticoccaceae bacterium]
MIHNKMSMAVKTAMGIAAVTGVMATSSVYAQDEALEEVIVTGSRIAQADLEGANPVTVIDRAQMLRTGAPSVGEILQNLPSSAGGAVNTGVNNGGSGAVRFSLRGLGSQRTLVLINGKRAVASGLGADSSVDLNNIPSGMIERVEVLKDGASAIYGSDAIAGVVNIITRSDFEGAEWSSTFGQTSESDGDQTKHEFILGTTSDKGNFVVSGYWAKQEPIWAGDREYSKEEIWFHPYWDPEGQASGGSSAPPWGNYKGSDGVNYTRGPEYLDSWRVRNGQTDAYNYAPANYTQTPNERWGFSGFGNYNIGDIGMLKNVEASGEVMYTHRKSQRLIAPEPLAPLVFFGVPAPYSDLNYYNITQGPKNADGETMVIADWRRRMLETGGRDQLHETNTHQISLGLSGDISDWNWSVSATYGENDANVIDQGYFQLERVGDAVGPTFMDAGGNLLCSTDGTEAGVIPGCVPLNVFGIPGTDTEVTAEMLEYVSGNYVSITEGGNDMLQTQANISGTIMELPAGPLGMAAGIEHRSVNGFSQPDSLQLLGVSTAGSALATAGGYSLDEAYVEFAIPVLENLELSIASRYSDYSTFGSTTNSKVGVRWTVNDDLVIRGSVSEAFRAPGIPDLYAGSSSTFPSVVDPCADDATPSCIADGVPAGGYDDTGIIQIPSKAGGNVNAQPETADTMTIGAVFQPSWADGLAVTVDYWSTEIDNAISTIGPQVILDNCHATGTDCDKIDRWGVGSPAGQGNVIFIYDLTANVGGVDADGVDLSVSYQMPETEYGLFGVRFDAAFLGSYDKTLSTGAVIKHAGEFKDNDDGNFPDLKFTLGVNWTRGDWSANYTGRYIDEVHEDLTKWFSVAGESRMVDSQFVHDIQASYDLSDYNSIVTFGVDNVTDEQPPFAYSGFNDNTDPRTYDTRGRYMYGRITFAF